MRCSKRCLPQRSALVERGSSPGSGRRGDLDSRPGRRGRGPAVEAALGEIGPGPVLIVNSDLPSVTADDLRALHDAIPERGIAIAPARDGTTNALGLSSTTFFAPLYGPGSAARFRAHAEQVVEVDRPGLRDDVDTPADLVAS